jgi:23S rRNA (cytidine1920-2'-O)/16S rRNA (cytidine1409-2'-O)-methyltransferase
VRIGGETAGKAGKLYPADCSPEVLEDPNPYVSRGGLKLERALRAFGLNPDGKTAADIGASAGGFTDCLLRHGAKRVYAVDVGYGQLDWKLRNDPRVVVIDRVNARYLEPATIGEPVDLAVVDVSFISLRLVIPPVLKLLKTGGDLVALVKPQFEVGREEVENKGVIRNPRKHLGVLLELRRFVREQGWVLCNAVASPITGQKGNREFPIHCRDARTAGEVDEQILRGLV